MPPKTEAIARLRRQLTQLQNVPTSQTDRSGMFDRWHRATRVAVDHVFGDKSKQSQEFSGVNYHPFIVTHNTTHDDRQRSYSDGLKRAQLLLESFIEEIEEYWPSDQPDETEVTKREYDVCLSFAGEDRTYVEAVAESLRLNGIRPFYDLYEEVKLWGKDLYQHLDDVYRHRARYCVLFISEAYAKKLWTKHELRSAQTRAFEEHEEYILPARFDDTDLPGVRSTVSYIDLRQKDPAQFAHLVVQKIRGETAESQPAKRFTGVEAKRVPLQKIPSREPQPHVTPIRPWFTTVRLSERSTLREEPSGPLKALLAPFRNDPTLERPHIAPASRLSATVWLEDIPDVPLTGYWLDSDAPHISLAVGEQWLLVVAVVAPGLASLVMDRRRGDAGAVELKHFWTTPTNITETTAVVSIVNDGVLLGRYRYSLKLTPFPDISLLSD